MCTTSLILHVDYITHSACVLPVPVCTACRYAQQNTAALRRITEVTHQQLDLSMVMARMWDERGKLQARMDRGFNLYGNFFPDLFILFFLHARLTRAFRALLFRV